jgi:hypothetical protein
MITNVGGIDRILRIVLGLALIVWAIYSGNLLGWIGIVPLLTGLFRFCPAYLPFGFKSCQD